MKTVTILAIFFLLVPGAVMAASGAGAINMTFNTSARFNGMGNTGNAVTWDQETNHWANPAVMAYRPGIHYRSYESQLAVGLADDIWISNKELTLGAYGVTLLLAKGPLEGNYLDMGAQEGTDENGESTGTFNSYMETQSWGLAADGVQIMEYILKKDPGVWSRYVGLAGGMVWHDFKDQLAPDSYIQDLGGSAGAEGSCKSMGYSLQLTYGDLSRGGGLLNNGVLGLYGGAAYGASVQNKADDMIKHLGADQDDPYPRAYRSGWAYTAQITLADNLRESLNKAGFGFLGDMINPLLSYTRAEDLSEPGYIWTGDDYEYEHDTRGLFDEKGRGWEIGIANIFFIREGHFTATYADVDDKAEGGGWKIQAGRLGGFRKDWADIPQASGLPTRRTTGWSVWVDPLAIKETFFD